MYMPIRRLFRFQQFPGSLSPSVRVTQIPSCLHQSGYLGPSSIPGQNSAEQTVSWLDAEIQKWFIKKNNESEADYASIISICV